MKSQLQQQNVVVTQLKENMRALESKISEAKSKKDMYIARLDRHKHQKDFRK